MQRLRPLMFVIPPFEMLEDRAVQDELLAGGVRDLLFAWGRLYDEHPDDSETVVAGVSKGRFVDHYYAWPRQGQLVAPPFAATEELYRGLGAEPPQLEARLKDKAERLAQLTEELDGRGFRVYYFGYRGAGVDGEATWASDEAQREHQWDYVAARYKDFMLHYPTVAGFVTDGPGFGYEITPGFSGGGQLFAPLPATSMHLAIADRTGVDLDALQAGSERAEALFHDLTPDRVDLFLDSELGVFDGIDLFLENDDVVDLLRFKMAVVEFEIGAHYRSIKAIDSHLEYGICPRLPCFATMQGVNFRRLSRLTDFIQSKHYLWMEGIDGFKGTLARYQQTLHEWNPGLDEARIEALVCRLLGVKLPASYPISDFDQPGPRGFFDEVVYSESRKMLFRIGDASRISPFLGLEHGGIWLNAEELRMLLQAMTDAGLSRFTYYILNTITDDIWDVMTEFTAP